MSFAVDICSGHECGPLVLDTAGAIRLGCECGADLTPRQAKAQALLLLLLVENTRATCTRIWLQDKLWSTADRVQGAQSLRQTLRQLKLALGPHADMLHADRARIGIDRGRILVRHDGSADLAEGLDIGDPEFEDWLQHARSAVTRTDARAPAVAVGQALPRPFSANSEPARLTLGVRCGPSDMSMDWAAALVADMVSNAAREQFEVEPGEPAQGRPGRECVIHAFRPAPERVGVRAVVTGRDGQRFWAGFRIVTFREIESGGTSQLWDMVGEVVDAVRSSLNPAHATAAELQTPDALCAAAIKAMFTMRSDKAALADRLLTQAAVDAPHRGIYPAWQAQLKVIELIEQFNTDREGLREQAEALTTRAMELEPDNAAVLASCANAWNFVQGRRVAAHELAQRAIAVNPSNPMAWWASSVTRMYGDNLGTGYLEAQRGQALARRSPHAFWWDSQIGFMALLHGESDEAIRRFERTALLMPEFRPALRYLIGLYASRRQFDAAQRAVERLRLVEPGFSVEQMVRDPGYPVSLLARAPDLDLEPLAELC